MKNEAIYYSKQGLKLVRQSKDSSRYGRNTKANFCYLSNYEKYQKIV